MIEYDSSPEALFFPETRPTVFGTGDVPGDEALAIEASRLAYLHFETKSSARQQLSSALRAVGFEGPTTFNDRSVVPIGFFTDSQGYAAIRRSDGLALLAFRGTQPTRPRDILLDLNFDLATSSQWAGSVHHGFLHAAQALWPDVEAWLAGEGAQRKSLLVCGHSLGAAIATLIAMRAAANRLVTIGSPRVGDAAFVAALEKAPIKRTRIVDSLDIVAQIPPKFLGYRHPRDGVLIDAAGHIASAPTASDLDRDVGAETLVRLAFPIFGGLPKDLTDHATVNYLRAYWK